jgi:Zn-dependent peptidase ImmA (M78 family)
MNIGQVNFNGGKLKEAREARGITITELSDLLDISRQSINQYEKGEQNPKIEILEKISEKLNLPKHFFLSPSEAEQHGLIFYRSLLKTNQIERKSTEQKLKWFKEIILYLRNYFEFIPVNLPKINLPNDFKSITLGDIEQIAEMTRKFWNIGNGAISNLTILAENNGIIINRGEFKSLCIDAFSEWNKDSLPIIVQNSEKDCAVRSRFDIAHELGHLILHGNVTANDFTQTNLKILEKQANYFAGAFMLPASSFTKDFYYPSLDVFRTLKEKWKMSIGAMINRTESLNILDKNQIQRMWINYSRKGWRGNEPLDDVIEIEEPQFIKRCFKILIEKNIQTRRDIELNLSYSLRDIELLSNLPEGYLRSNTNELLSVTPKIRKDIGDDVPIFSINGSRNN